MIRYLRWLFSGSPDPCLPCNIERDVPPTHRGEYVVGGDYLLGYEDRMKGRGSRRWRIPPYYFDCQCARCCEYQTGHDDASRRIVKDFRRRSEDDR